MYQLHVGAMCAAILLGGCGDSAVPDGTATVATAQLQAVADQEQANIQRFLEEQRKLDDAVNNGGMPNCFNPSLSGQQRRVAERLGGVPCDEENAETTSQPGPGADFRGHWQARFDGGAGTATLAQMSPGSKEYDIRLVVAGTDGCAGEVSGRGTVSGTQLTLNRPYDDAGQCRVSFTRRGAQLVVAEEDCSYFHGASCGFSGSASFEHGTDYFEPVDHAE